MKILFFSEEDMMGMIENVAIIQTPQPPKETKPTDRVEVPLTSETISEETETTVEPSEKVQLSCD